MDTIESGPQLIIKGICRRQDLTESLKQLQCKTLIFVGESSPFHAESVHMSAKMDSKSSALVEVGCFVGFCFAYSHFYFSWITHAASKN